MYIIYTTWHCVYYSYSSTEANSDFRGAAAIFRFSLRWKSNKLDDWDNIRRKPEVDLTLHHFRWFVIRRHRDSRQRSRLDARLFNIAVHPIDRQSLHESAATHYWKAQRWRHCRRKGWRSLIQCLAHVTGLPSNKATASLTVLRESNIILSIFKISIDMFQRTILLVPSKTKLRRNLAYTAASPVNHHLLNRWVHGPTEIKFHFVCLILIMVYYTQERCLSQK